MNTKALISVGAIVFIVMLGQWAHKHDLNFFTVLIGLGMFALLGVCIAGTLGYPV